MYPLVIGVNSAYAGAMVYMSNVWYTSENRTSFHFYNDLPQWKQMDKMGHMMTSFTEADVIARTLKWAGMSERNSHIYGAIGGFLYQAPIEIFDGFEKSYGASVSDLGANAMGSLLYLSQYLAWQSIRIKLKFSFQPSSLARLRPDVLGSSLSEQILKDYNGQTYWLAFNVNSFFQHKSVPRWINLSIGYSARNMLYGRDHENIQAGFRPFRQYFLSVDFDFDHVPIKSKFVKTLLYPLNIIHIPFPALEFSNNKFKFHPLYF